MGRMKHKTKTIRKVILFSFGHLDVKSSRFPVTCAKIGGQECGQSHNLELCAPNIRCDLSKVILLKDKKHSRSESVA